MGRKGRRRRLPDVKFSEPKPGIYFVQKTDVNQSSINMLDLGIERNNPDYYAVTVMNEIFGGGFSSRLFNNLRSDKGLAYAVGGGVGSGWDHPGLDQYRDADQERQHGGRHSRARRRD